MLGSHYDLAQFGFEPVFDVFERRTSESPNNTKTTTNDAKLRENASKGGEPFRHIKPLLSLEEGRKYCMIHRSKHALLYRFYKAHMRYKTVLAVGCDSAYFDHNLPPTTLGSNRFRSVVRVHHAQVIHPLSRAKEFMNGHYHDAPFDRGMHYCDAPFDITGVCIITAYLSMSQEYALLHSKLVRLVAQHRCGYSPATQCQTDERNCQGPM